MSSKPCHKKGEAAPSAPVFLRKTYELINTCDHSVASWSKDGTTFVVRDPKRFQYEFIPKYFKHNNFSSFVRQLNFYGFHKVKTDPLLLHDANPSDESKYWRFHHEKFRRGHLDLIAEIRKSNHAEAAEKQEVDVLKHEVNMLRDHIAETCGEMEAVKALLGSLLQQGQQANQKAWTNPQTASKRRKVSHPGQPPSVTADCSPNQPGPLTLDHNHFATAADEPMPLSVHQYSYINAANNARDHLMPHHNHSRSDVSAIGNPLSFQEEDSLLTSLFALDPLDEIDVLENDDRTFN